MREPPYRSEKSQKALPEQSELMQELTRIHRRKKLRIPAICAAGVLAAAVFFGASYTMCYTVNYQGNTVAYVDNKDASAVAVLKAEELTSGLLDKEYSLTEEVSVKATIAPRSSVSELPEATDSIMENIPELKKVFTISVDGTVIGSVEDYNIINRALERVKDRYRTPETLAVDFENGVTMDHGFLPQDASLVDEDTIVARLMAETPQTFLYTTQEGDTLSGIAELFSMTPERLEELNQDKELVVEATDADLLLEELNREETGEALPDGEAQEDGMPVDETMPVVETLTAQTSEKSIAANGATVEETASAEAVAGSGASSGEKTASGERIFPDAESGEENDPVITNLSAVPEPAALQEESEQEALTGVQGGLTEEEEELLASEDVNALLSGEDLENLLSEPGFVEEEFFFAEPPLQPGQVITVEQTCPLLVVTTVEEQTSDRQVMPEKLTLLDGTLPVGQEQILIEGVPGEETVLLRVTKRCGVPVSASDMNAVVKVQAEPLLVAVGYGSHPEMVSEILSSTGFSSVMGSSSSTSLFQWPVQGRISSDYGYRYIFGGLNFHRGIDIPAAMGTAVHAAASGRVTFSGVKGSYGNLVIIDHGNGFESYYGHNSRLLVSAGDEVLMGQTIAAVGSTGRSTGPHCHFEVHFNGQLVDPLLYLPGSNNAPARTQAPMAAIDIESIFAGLSADSSADEESTQSPIEEDATGIQMPEIASSVEDSSQETAQDAPDTGSSESNRPITAAPAAPATTPTPAAPAAPAQTAPMPAESTAPAPAEAAPAETTPSAPVAPTPAQEAPTPAAPVQGSAAAPAEQKQPAAASGAEVPQAAAAVPTPAAPVEAAGVPEE